LLPEISARPVKSGNAAPIDTLYTHPQGAAMSNVFIGRQPIFDRQNQVFAYELLWRGGADNQAGFADGDLATTQVMLNALTEIGLDRLGVTPSPWTTFSIDRHWSRWWNGPTS